MGHGGKFYVCFRSNEQLLEIFKEDELGDEQQYGIHIEGNWKLYVY
jgi:hypothetical protein